MTNKLKNTFMKKLLMAAAVITAITFSGCNAGGGDPKSVLVAFFDAMSKKDFVAAKKLATKDSESMFSLMEMGKNMAKSNDKDDMNFDKSKTEIGEAKIEGDKATVAVKDKEKNESINFLLKKEDGAWKVAFNKEWISQMAMQKMGEKGMDMNSLMDTVSNGMDKIKDINVDSLTNAMKEAGEKIDQNKEKIEEAAKKLEEAAKKMNQ